MAVGNIDLWDALATTPPSATKPFQRGGGFRGKSIDPMYRYKRMTEQFGACGTGWGIHSPTFQTVPAGEEILVFCTVVVWYGSDNAELVGVGGDKVLVKTKYGISADDEGFKKAYTDAIGNALKYLGVGADVFMGQHDDDKYVRALRQQEQSEEPFEPVTYPNPPLRPSGLPQTGYRKDGARTAHSLNKSEVWQNEFMRELNEVQTLPMLEKFRWTWSKKAEADRWPEEWKELAVEEIRKHKAFLLQPVNDDDSFPGDRP